MLYGSNTMYATPALSYVNMTGSVFTSYIDQQSDNQSKDVFLRANLLSVTSRQ